MKLKRQIRENYHLNKDDITQRHAIQFAFYSYFMYKDLKSKQNLTFDDRREQIKYLIEALEIFKNLMGENIDLQN